MFPSWYAKERTLYAKFAQHTHTFAYSIDGNKITKSCTAEGCPGGVGGTATLTANDATYDGKSHAATAAKTGDVTTSISYNTADGQAPTAAGTYEVTMKVDGGTAENSTLSKSFTISPASITAVTLNATSFNYDGTDKTTSIKSVKAGSLTLGDNDYEVSGDAMTQTGSLTEKKTYTVTVTGKGNYTGSASASWTINNPSGSFKDDALKPGAGCEANGNTATVNDSAKLVYANGKWYASITIELPNDQIKDGSYVQGATFVNAANTRVEYKGKTYTGSQIQGGAVPELTAPTETPVDYKYGWIYEQRTYKYLPSVTYTMELTPEIIAKAKAEEKIEDSVTVYALAWKDDQDYGTFGCETGLKPTTYTLTVLIGDNLKLFDENNQVYPELPYIANIGAKKYLTLAEALGAATAGQTVEVFADAAAEGELTVPAGVALNLGSHGNTGTSYVLTGAELDATAKVVSEKDETVSVRGEGVGDDFFRVVKNGNVYELALNHVHSWGDFTLNGNVLTATCTNEKNPCTVAGAQLAVTLTVSTVSKEYDGNGFTAALTDSTAFAAFLTDGGQHEVAIGDVAVERPAYCGTDKWYTGAYAAKCTVTIDGVDYTLAQAVSITKPEGGYTDGFEAQGVGGCDVRFNTLAEAAGVAEARATIYYRGGDFNKQEITFSSGKDITVDLGGKTLTYNQWATMTIRNDGAGKVTFVNGTIKQPKGPMNAGHVTLAGGNGGSMAFGEGMSFVNQASNDDNYLTVTADGIAVAIDDGQYQAGFAAKNGGSVVISGGQFWKNDKPTALAADHIVREIEGDYKYEVVEHHHEHHYEVEGGVVTATCAADDHAYCGFGTQTLTLTAQSEQHIGIDTLGATKTESDGFPVKDLAIVYLDGEGQVVADIATAGAGTYTAQVTVADGVVAQVSFTVIADPIDISNATFELAHGSFAYDGKEHTNAVKTAMFGGYALVEGTDYTVSGDSFAEVGSPAEDKTYTVTLTGIGKFTATTNLSWTITAPEGKMGKLQEVKGVGQAAFAGTVEGTTLTVTQPTNLCFLSGAWYAGLSVEVPNSVDGWSSDNSSGTNPDDLRLGFSHAGDLSQVDTNRYTWALSQKTMTYAKSITWFAKFTLSEIEEAIDKGELVRTLTVSAVPGEFNKAGIREVVYTIRLTLADLVLPVPAEKTLDAGDVVIDGFQLQLGKKATVTADARVTDFAAKIVSDGTAGYAVTESGEGPYTYKNAAVSYQITYQFEGNDGKTPTNPNPTSYTVAEAITFAAVTLDGYEFKGWNPAKIESGTTGDQTVIGTFEKIAPPTITITIAKDTGVADVQTNGVTVVGALELPADATTVELTLVADGLTIPVYKVVRDDVTNVTSKTEVYTIAAGDTLAFLADEAGETDPTVADDKIKQAIVDAIDEGASHDAAVAKVGAVVGEGANQVSAKALAGYITDKNVSSEDLAKSDYVAASVKLDTAKLIGEKTDVEIVDLVKAEGDAMTFEVTIDDSQVKVEAIKDMVEASSDLSDWENKKLEVEAAFDEGKVTITPKDSPDKAFMKVVIPKDPE